MSDQAAMAGRTPRFINLLQEFSIPLILGVVVAMLLAVLLNQKLKGIDI